MPKAKPRTKSASKKNEAVEIMSDERRRLIAETAYYLAEQRGFHERDPINDWLEAETHINTMLMK